jgi:YbgC/YbaW family acyl-CoA thioester hydrolase
VTHVYSHRLAVRFRDCDAMGHANNAAYLTYLEEARFQHWRALWGRRGEAFVPDGDAAVPAGVPGVIVARAEIDYRRPARYGDTLEIRLGIAGFGRTSFTYEYEIIDASGGVVATARTVIVSFDYLVGKPKPIPDEMKEALSRRLL